MALGGFVASGRLFSTQFPAARFEPGRRQEHLHPRLAMGTRRRVQRGVRRHGLALYRARFLHGWASTAGVANGWVAGAPCPSRRMDGRIGACGHHRLVGPGCRAAGSHLESLWRPRHRRRFGEQFHRLEPSAGAALDRALRHGLHRCAAAHVVAATPMASLSNVEERRKTSHQPVDLVTHACLPRRHCRSICWIDERVPLVGQHAANEA